MKVRIVRIVPIVLLMAATSCGGGTGTIPDPGLPVADVVFMVPDAGQDPDQGREQGQDLGQGEDQGAIDLPAASDDGTSDATADATSDTPPDAPSDAIPDPAMPPDVPVVECTDGDGRCEGADAAQSCASGQWQPAEACPDGWACVNKAGKCLSPCAQAELAEGNEGCEFWLVQMGNNGNEGYNSGSDTPKWTAGVSVFVVNPSDDPAHLVLSSFGATHDLGDAATIAPHATVLFPLPVVTAGAQANKFVVDGSTLAYAGLSLASDRPVVAYQFNPATLTTASSDASLVLPVHALGTTHRIATVAHAFKRIDSQTWSHPGRFTILSTKDGTQVTITPTAPSTALAIPAWDFATAGEFHDPAPLAAGVARTFTLNRFQILQIETFGDMAACSKNKVQHPVHGYICIDEDDWKTGQWCNVYGRKFCQPGADLSGSLVESDAPVAVFAGAKNAMIPYWMFGTEHIEEQLPPVDRWGRHYIAARIEPRFRYYTCSRGNLLSSHDSTCPYGSGVSFWKVVAAYDDTVITIDTPTAPVTVKEAPPAPFNYHNQVDWTTSVSQVGGLPCQAVDGHCRVQATLGAGDVFAFQDVFTHVVHADKPILVVQFMPGEEYVGIPSLDPSPYITLLQQKGGDPAMAVLVPVDQFRRGYTFHVLPTMKYGYIAITAKAGDTLVLDEGTPQAVTLDTTGAGWEATGTDWVTRIYEIHNTANYDAPREVPGAAYSDDKDGGGSHTIRSTLAPFGIQVYGFDHYVSYMYPGGQAVTRIPFGTTGWN